MHGGGLAAEYTGDAVAAVGTGDDRDAALDRALAAAGLDAALAAAAGERNRAELSVAIKPKLVGDGARTDPALVELLIARLRSRGCERIAVVETAAEDGRPLGELARDAGYSGAGYEIVDLAADTVPHDHGGVIGVAPAGRAWLEADVRISFAKNRTHRRLLYSGSMTNVIGCLPGQRALRRRHALSDLCRTLLEAMPLTFALVDAWDSADGGGARARRPTRAVLASTNAYALDWLMGELMGVDPRLNPVVQEGLLRFGRIRVDRRGNLTPWEPWRNPALVTVALAGIAGGRRAAWTAQ
jgi:uncharacterized protein (DUF362 family)